MLVAVAGLALVVACAGPRMQRPPQVSPEAAVGEGDREERAPPAAESSPAGEAAVEPRPEEAKPHAARTTASGADRPPSEEPVEPEEPREPAPHDQLATVSPAPGADALAEELSRVEQAAPRYDVPVVFNEAVLAWLDYYAGRKAEWFQPGLVRSGRYVQRFREIFAEAGIPQDLVYMAHVESAYKPYAYSRAGAKGIFQFIASTARKYGLRVDEWVDERADPEKSARAAVAYLKDLYAEFRDWYLALAAYNAGEGTIRRAIARTGEADFWSLARTAHLRRETKNYVPAILAAIVISKDPGRFGFDFEPEPPLLYETIRVEDAVDLRVLARCAGVDLATLRELNPALRRHQTPPGRASEVHVPAGLGEATLAALRAIPREQWVVYHHHRVRAGDTLWALARRYGVSVRAIQQANGMGSRTLLRVGHVLKVPTSHASTARVRQADRPAQARADGHTAQVYRVRRGDTLWSIARRFGVTPQAIAGENGMSVGKTLYPGEALRIPARRPGGAPSAVHTVRQGDTLWSIAQRYRSSVPEICTLNAIEPDTVLHPGMELAVPVP